MMTKKIIRADRGFSLTELIIVMGIMLLVVYMSMSSHIGDVTAKQEAEKLEVWLARITQQAIRMRRTFELTASGANLQVTWTDTQSNNTEKFDADAGFTFSYNKAKISYNTATNGVGTTNGHFTITAKDNSKYYLIVSTTGRIRLSETKPAQDE